MTEFKKGQRVRVEFEGIVDWFDGEVLQLSSDIPRESHRLVKVDTFNTKVTPAGPADWPPQVGDIWEAEGEEYYACDDAFGDGIRVESFDYGKHSESYKNLDPFKALNPVLVRRRGQ
jgi:hypothetical protein